MIYLLETELQDNKSLYISLRYVFGIGNYNSTIICKKLGFSKNFKVSELTEEQKELLKQVATPIVELIKEGHEVVIAHGNGPQVGMINLAFIESASTPLMPFPECGAMSQGYIGFHLQNAIGNELAARNIDKSIASIVTQVIVDEKDPAFDRPTKPIGSFYSKEEADQLSKTMGYKMIEDSGRGYRRVVPSPLPIDVKEKAIIKYICQGKTSKEISSILFITKNTVDTHRKNINRKLELSNTSTLIKFANENNLFS